MKEEAERKARGAGQVHDEAPPGETTFSLGIKRHLGHELFVRCNSSTFEVLPLPFLECRVLVRKEPKEPDSCRKCGAAIGYD